MQIWWSLSALWDSINYISKFIGKLEEHLVLTRLKCFGFHCLILFLFQAVHWDSAIYNIKLQMIMLALNISPSFTERCSEPKYFGTCKYVGDFCTAFWFGLKVPNTQFPLPPRQEYQFSASFGGNYPPPTHGWRAGRRRIEWQPLPCSLISNPISPQNSYPLKLSHFRALLCRS